MTATNHTASGILIGTLLPLPLAIPLALASHFVLDAIPHYTDDELNKDPKKFMKYLIIDCGMAASLLIATIVLVPGGWFGLVLCGILAASPDLMWLPYWLKSQEVNKKEYTNIFEKFHHKIQWSETKKGLIIEAILFPLILATISTQLW
ncbi:MAG: hypothetical protein AAB459_00775 [Patescibacteria group bacterium]